MKLRSEWGAALAGLVIALVVFLGVAFVVTTVAFLDVTVSNEEETERRIAKLVEAIGGIPESQASITQGTGGFLGDVGRFPESLEELNDRTASGTLYDPANDPTPGDPAYDPTPAPAYHTADTGTNHRGRVGMGWNGPYYKEMVYTDEHLRDAWGVKLRYTCAEDTRNEDGTDLTFRTGLITSAGRDGQFDTGDDIKSENFYDRGHLYLRITQGGADKEANPNLVTATLYYVDNGEQTSVTTGIVSVSTTEGSVSVTVFSSVPAGVRFVQIDFGASKKELYHTFIKSNVANEIDIKIPLGQGGKA